MMTKKQVVAALVRLYPAAWRAEYELELTDILLARPLNARAIGDVMWNGLRQRALSAEPSTILGLAALLIILARFALSGATYGHDGTALLQPSSKTFPTVTVTFLASEFYAILLMGCGCWTHFRRGGPAWHAGVAAMKMSLIASMPIMVGALLMMSGLVDLTGPGGSVHLPSPWSILVAPLARLYQAWLWGSIGGFAGKSIVRRRQRAASA